MKRETSPATIHRTWHAWHLVFLLAACLPVCTGVRADEKAPVALEASGHARVTGVSLQLDERESQLLAKDPTLTVGVLPNGRIPFDMVDLDNRYEGISADYLDVIAKVLRVTLKVLAYDDKEAALLALARGDIDIVPSMPSADARTGAALSAPYFPARDVQVVVPDRPVDKNAEIRVGYVSGHVSPNALRRAYPNARLSTFGSEFAGLTAVAGNGLDIFVGSGAGVSYLIDRYSLSLHPTDFDVESNSSFHFAMRASDSMRLRLVDRALAAIPARAIDDIKLRWLAAPSAIDTARDAGLSEKERRWIATHPRVRIAASEDRIPFIFVNQSGYLDGLSIQVLDLISTKTGLAFVPIDTARQSAPASGLAGPAELLPVVARGAQSPAGLAVTDAYFQAYWVVVSRAGEADFVRVDDLAGKRIAYQPPNGVAAKIKERVPSAHLIPVTSIPASYEEVASGRADATVTDIVTASFLIQHHYADRLKVAGAMDEPPVDIAFAVQSAHPELRSILNKTLESVSPEAMRRVHENWIFPRRHTIDWSIYYRWAYGAGAVLLFCLALFVIWNRSLHKEVQRTMAVKKQLREELAFRDAMLDGMPHAIAVRDRDLRLTLCNAAFKRAYSVSNAVLLGRKPSEHLYARENPEAVAQVELRYRDVLDKGVHVSEDIDMTVNGQKSQIFHWASPISLREGDPPVALVSGAVDITQRYQLLDMIESARTKAETANRAKSNFLATMSHEIRSPMNAIMGMLELLLRRGRLGEQDKESIEVAHASAKSLLELIDDILDISKIEAGGLEIVLRPAQLRRTVADVAQVFEGLARQRGLTIDVKTDPAISTWHETDALRFRQIVYNLVSNAIKYTDTGGIHLRLQHVGRSGDVETIALEVEDSGIGIAAEDIPHLFQPFFQAEAAGPRTQGGTGLGLPIVQRICARMNGKISVDSKPGHGTLVRVTFELPVLSAPEPELVSAVGASEWPARLGPPGRYNLLIVDDHPANRLLLQSQLDHLGFRSDSADNGESALAKWRDDVFDLVITDCSMPVMDGYELTVAIRAQEREQNLPRCPILAWTAHAQEEDRRHALSVGMDECLIKPTGLDELLRALVRHLDSDDDLSVAAPAASGLDGRFDVGSLKTFSGGDGTVEANFLDALLRTNLSDLMELQTLVQSDALQEAAACAHKIKGAARIVKATEVVHACEAVEAAFRADDKAGMVLSVEVLSTNLEKLNEAISIKLRSLRNS